MRFVAMKSNKQRKDKYNNNNNNKKKNNTGWQQYS